MGINPTGHQSCIRAQKILLVGDACQECSYEDRGGLAFTSCGTAKCFRVFGD